MYRAASRTGRGGPHPRGEGARGAAAGAAGSALRVPRVAGDAEQQVLGERRVPELRRVGLPQQYGARLLQPLYLHGVSLRHVVLEGHGGMGRREAYGVLQLLDAEREPGQGAYVVAVSDAVS